MTTAFPLKKAAYAVAATAALLMTGCAGPTAGSGASPSPTIETSSIAETPSASAAPLASTGQTPVQSMAPSYEDRLAVGSYLIKAGANLHVYGGTLDPGTTVQVYAAQQMAMPSYDAANDMYHQVGDEIKLSDTVTATVDAKGTFDVQLLIPAGTPAQTINIISILSDGRGDLVQTTIQ